MELHVWIHKGSSLVRAEPSNGGLPTFATIVLRHPDGPVGFDRQDGAVAMTAFCGGAVVIERSNSPRWTWASQGEVSSTALHQKFKRVVTCRGPRPALLQELESVTANRVKSAKNQVLARHGRPVDILTPTEFDSWVLSDGRIRERSVSHLVGLTDLVVLWSFADWGLFAEVPALSSREARRKVAHVAAGAELSFREVETEADLPHW